MVPATLVRVSASHCLGRARRRDVWACVPEVFGGSGRPGRHAAGMFVLESAPQHWRLWRGAGPSHCLCGSVQARRAAPRWAHAEAAQYGPTSARRLLGGEIRRPGFQPGRRRCDGHSSWSWKPGWRTRWFRDHGPRVPFPCVGVFVMASVQEWRALAPWLAVRPSRLASAKTESRCGHGVGIIRPRSMTEPSRASISGSRAASRSRSVEVSCLPSLAAPASCRSSGT